MGSLMQYKEALKADLEVDPRVTSVVDVGVAATDDATYDPDVAIRAAEMVRDGLVDRALLVGGPGWASGLVRRRSRTFARYRA